MISRHCYTLTLRPGKEEEYQRLHEEIWPELAEGLRGAGVHDMTLFRRGREVFGFFSCSDPDPAAALARLDAQDVSVRWDATMRDVIESFGETPAEIWRLD